MILTSNYIFDTKTKTTFAGYIHLDGKKIVSVGPINDCPTSGEVMDYGDAMIVPGFIDAHVHLFLSVLLHSKKLTYIHGLSENEVAEQVPHIPTENGWKIGIGWYASEFGQNVHPTRKSLDAVCPDTPVMLIAGDAHTIWLNTKAMEVMDIRLENIPQGISGEALRDEKGLTGVFLEAVAIHFLAEILAPLKANFDEELQMYGKHLNQMGITTVGDVALTGEAKDDLIDPALYSASQAGTHLRINFYPAMREDTKGIEKIAQMYQSESLQFGGVKQFFDGVTSTHTAFMKNEYTFPYFPGDIGSPLIPAEKMRRLILLANEKGWSMRIHTIGDQAIRLALEYYQESEKKHPLPTGQYNTLEHLEVMDGKDLPLVNQEQLVISVQPSHLLVGWEALDAEVGPIRAKQMFPFRDFLAEGATLAFGTDTPVVIDITPLQSIYFAVERKDLAGEPSQGLMPEQKISIGEALYAHTKGGALALSRNDIGSLEPGMLADITILDRNLLAATPQEILTTKIVATYFNGEKIV